MRVRPGGWGRLQFFWPRPPPRRPIRSRSDSDSSRPCFRDVPPSSSPPSGDRSGTCSNARPGWSAKKYRTVPGLGSRFEPAQGRNLIRGVLHGFVVRLGQTGQPGPSPLIAATRTNRSSRRYRVNGGHLFAGTQAGQSGRPGVVVSKGSRPTVTSIRNLRKGSRQRAQPTGPAKGMAEDAITAVLPAKPKPPRRLRRDQELPGDAARPREEHSGPVANPNRSPSPCLAVKKGQVDDQTMTQIRDGLTQGTRRAKARC